MTACLTLLRPRGVVVGCRCDDHEFGCEVCRLGVLADDAVFEVVFGDWTWLACANCASAVTADDGRRAGVDVRLHRGGHTAGRLSFFDQPADLVVAMHRALVRQGLLRGDDR